MLHISYCLVRRKSWCHVKFCHPWVYSNVTIAFFPLLLDINECSTNVQNCDANAFCSNSEGSYNCTCRPGYNGNGRSCTGKSYYYYYYYYFSSSSASSSSSSSSSSYYYYYILYIIKYIFIIISILIVMAYKSKQIAIDLYSLCVLFFHFRPC